MTASPSPYRSPASRSPIAVDRRGGVFIQVVLALIFLVGFVGVFASVHAHGWRATGVQAMETTLFFFACLHILGRRVRVVFDGAGGDAVVSRPKFPWGQTSQRIALQELGGAELQSSRIPSTSFFEQLLGLNQVYRVVLRAKTGEEIPLTTGYSSGLRWHERWRDELNDALRTTVDGAVPVAS